jgi:hypothetical protein
VPGLPSARRLSNAGSRVRLRGMRLPGTRAQYAIPSWVPLLLGLLGVMLVLWAAYLAEVLPVHHLSHHWDVAWTGFDLALATTLIGAAVAALRRSPWVSSLAAAAATLLACDAWFDVVTARDGGPQLAALAMALFVELPLALGCLWLVRRAEMARRRETSATGSAGVDEAPIRPQG